VVSRALGGARADIRHVIFEGLAPLFTVVAATEDPRGKPGDRADRKHQHQSFASHLFGSFF
jgi:hypothetical protein